MREKEKSGVITRVSVEKCESGIIKLHIDTDCRWHPYHAFNDEWFAVFAGEDGSNENIIGEVKTKKIEKLMDKDHGYIRYHYQEKDTICYIWVPYDLLKSKKNV